MEINQYSRKLFLEKTSKNLILLSNSSRGKEMKVFRDLATECMKLDSREVDEVLSSLPNEKKAIFNDLLPDLISSCRDEWKGSKEEVKDSEKKDIPCSLCGTLTKLVFLIENKFNGKVINVGSTCVLDFTGMEFHNNKTRNQILKDYKKRKALSELVKQIPGITNKAKNYKNDLNRLEILIPYEIESTYLVVSQKLEELYDKAIEKGEDVQIDEFKRYVKLQDTEFSTIQSYVKEVKDDAWIVNRKIVNWLEVNNKQDVIDKLKETGYVTNEIAPQIAEKGFITEFAAEFNFLLNNSFDGAEIIEVDTQERVLIIKLYNNEDFFINLPVKKAATTFGWTIFATDRQDTHKQVSFSNSNLIMLSRVDDERSLEYAFNRIKLKLNGKIRIKLYQGSSIDNYTKEIEVKGFNKEGKITILGYQKFVHEFRRWVVVDAPALEENISSYIAALGRSTRHYTVRQLKDLREASREFNK